MGNHEPEPKSQEPFIALVRGLRLIGLPAREAVLYLVLVRGPFGAREAAELAGLHRATAYRLLLKLLDRGMVVGDGRSPQRFHAIGPEILLHRVEESFRDEAEIVGLLAEAYGPWVNGGRDGSEPIDRSRPRVLAAESRGTHPTLVELAETRISADVLVRPLSLAPTYRVGLVRALARLARRGVRVRLITDTNAIDRRFISSLEREASGSNGALQIRRYSPVLGHFYVLDEARVVRFPTLGLAARGSQLAILTETPVRVRTQSARFDATWVQSAAMPKRPQSINSYGWRDLLAKEAESDNHITWQRTTEYRPTRPFA